MNQPDFADAKVITPSTVQFPEQGAVQTVAANGQMDSLTRAEINIQIATAHHYPRSIKRALDDATAMATLNIETAESCFYKLPRSGKSIEGPSVRLAEIIGSAWGNMRYGARIAGEEKDFIIAQGIAHDLERNVACSIEVRRRIVDGQGRRYNADMIGVTANAAASIALRNAIFKVIPRSYTDCVYNEAKQVAIGDASTLNERRDMAIAFFRDKLNLDESRILKAIGRAGVDDITLDDLETLTGLKTAIREGDTTVDEAFPPLVKEKKHTGSDKAVQPNKAEKASNPAVDAPNAPDAVDMFDQKNIGEPKA